MTVYTGFRPLCGQRRFYCSLLQHSRAVGPCRTELISWVTDSTGWTGWDQLSGSQQTLTSGLLHRSPADTWNMNSAKQANRNTAHFCQARPPLRPITAQVQTDGCTTGINTANFQLILWVELWDELWLLLLSIKWQQYFYIITTTPAGTWKRKCMTAQSSVFSSRFK